MSKKPTQEGLCEEFNKFLQKQMDRTLKNLVKVAWENGVATVEKTSIPKIQRLESALKVAVEALEIAQDDIHHEFCGNVEDYGHHETCERPLNALVKIKAILGDDKLEKTVVNNDYENDGA